MYIRRQAAGTSRAAVNLPGSRSASHEVSFIFCSTRREWTATCTFQVSERPANYAKNGLNFARGPLTGASTYEGEAIMSKETSEYQRVARERAVVL